MDARPKTPDEIFGTHIRYVIPPFQRPYVWEEGKQWEPLWDDVARTAELALDTVDDGQSTTDGMPMHFLGAVVLQHVTTGTGYIRSCNVVDGQQRLTTLQLLMDAVQEVVAEHGDDTDAEALQDLVRNNPKKLQHEDEIFKVWPSRLDQAAFRAVMHVFLSVDRPGVDVDQWEREYWGDFDELWWRDEVGQGRHYRSRIDIFLQYWLTMRIQDDVPSDEVFKRFRKFAQGQLGECWPVVVDGHPTQQVSLFAGRREQGSAGLAVRISVAQQGQDPAGQVLREGLARVATTVHGVGLMEHRERLPDDSDLFQLDAAAGAAFGGIEHSQ